MIDIRGLPQRDYQGPSAAEEDPDIAAIRRVARQRANAGMLQDRDPSTVLRARALSRETGVPAPAIEGDVESFQQQVLQQNTARTLEKDPWLAQYLSDPHLAAAAKSDIPRLGNISKMVADEGEISTPFIDRLKRNNLGETALGSPSMRALGMSPTRSAIPLRPRDDNFADIAARARARVAGEQAGFDAQRPMLGPLGVVEGLTSGTFAMVGEAGVGATQYIADALGFAEETQGYFADRTQELKDFRLMHTPRGVDGGIAGGIYSGGQSLLDMAFLAGLGPAALLPALTGAVGTSSYAKYRLRGATPNEALVGGTGEAAVEYLTERLPIHYLTDRFGKGGAREFIGGYVAPELFGEQIATAVQDAFDTAIANPNKTWDEYWKERPEAALQTAIATGTMLGVIGGAGAIRHRLQREERDLARIEQGVSGAQFLDRLMREAETSEMRKGDPETFRQFVEQRTEGTPVQNLYLPVEAVEEYMQSEGYEAGFLELYQDQIAEAGATRGDVVIPLAEAAARMAGTPAWEALKDQVRLQPGGLSQKEALEKRDEIMATLEQRGAEIAQEAAAEGERVTPTVEVYESVRNELLSVGRSSQEAEKIAQLLAARREAAGARLGMTAAEYHAANPITFANGATGARAGGRTMAQADTTLADEQRNLLREAREAREAYIREITPTLTGTPREREAAIDAALIAKRDTDPAWQARTARIREISDLRAEPIQKAPAASNTPQTPAAPALIGFEDAPRDGSSPNVDWRARDLINKGSAASALKEYGRGKGIAYEAWVPIGDIPTPKGAGITKDGYPNERGGYDWSELQGRGSPPPATIIVNSKGKITIADGNHRLAFWRDQGFDYAPVFVIDERKDADKLDFAERSFDQTDDSAFKRWFGDSKVVDANGAPLVVYHGTKGIFDRFDGKRSRTSDEGLLGKGFYFTYNEGEASGYAHNEMFGNGGSPNVVAAYLSVKNPLLITDGKLPDGRKVLDIHGRGIDRKAGDEIRQIAEEGGHDGIIWEKRGGGVGHVVVFEPTQIKSVNNVGTFDPSDPRILHQDGVIEPDVRAYRDTPVAAITGEEIAPEGTPTIDLRKAARDWYDANLKGTTVWNEALGRDVKFGKSKKAFSASANPLKLKLFAALKDILAKGDLIDSVPPKEGDHSQTKAWHFIRARVETAGQGVEVTVSVREDSNGDIYYNHVLSKDDPAAGTRLAARKATDGTGDGGTTSTDTPLNPLDTDSKASPGTKGRTQFQDIAENADNINLSVRQGPRGSASFYADGSAIVTLFDTANLSTLIHELGHVFLEEMFRDAQHANAPTELKEDVAKIRNWFAANGAEIKNGVIPVEAHELWARGFERYAMEGKAPSVELQGVFTAFRAWLLRIYEVVQNLRAPINPEIREVFDRMLATQEAIDEAREAQNVAPLSQDALGMTDAEYAAYLGTISDARDEAYDALLFKTMAAIRRRENKKMREQRANVRADVAAEVNARPEFVALHLLRTGRWLGDPERETASVKLNSGWLMDTYGEDVIDKLPKGLPIHKGDGEEGDVVAEMTGFASGDQLVRSLIALREASDQLKATGETRSLRDKMIDDEVDRIMAERHGDVMTDGSIEEEAIAAINTARQGEIIAGEARQLAKRKSVLGMPTPYQFARAWARRKIQAGRVQEVVSRSALQRYTRATAKAARLAEQAILEENVDEAFRQKQAQLLNHALLAEGKVVADEVEAIIARMNRLAKRAAMKSVDQDYMDRIHEILEKYDFRPRSQRSLDEADSFAAWAQAQRDKGFEVHIPPRLMERGDHFSRLTVEELIGINDTVKSLLHLGKTKQKLKVAQEERDFREFRDEVVGRIRQLPDRKLPYKPINEEERALAGLASELLKVETLVEELDGGKTGPLHDLIVVGATEAANLRDQLRDRVLIPIAKTYKQLSRKQWKRLQEKVTIPELTWNTVNEGDPRQGKVVTITRMEMLAIYMNMGNLSNLEKLSKGERWPVKTLQAVIRREFDKSDYDLAQTLWNQVGALWPDIVRVERSLSGVVPEQVEALPIETPFGTYEGGYWPVVYDSSRSQRAEDFEGQRLDDMFGLKSGVATQKGHTITRTDAVGPFNLSIERVLFDHIEQAITRIAYTEYVREVLRVVKEPRIKGLIDTKLGPEYRKQIEPWLARQVHEGAVNAKAAKFWQKVIRHMRINMTIAAMGFRFSTGVAQTLGLAASAERIGALAVASGLKRMAANPAAAERFVAERSPEMMKRTQAVNRDVAEVFAKLRGKHSVLTEAQAWAFWHIGMIDRYAVAMPTWLGAHEKGMAEGMTDKEASAYADKEVRLSQGSGREKDLSAFQSPNHEAMRYFTMFYTPFNVMFNAQWQAVRGLKRGDPRKAIGVTFWWLLVSTLGDALLSGDWPEDDDGDGWAGDIMEWFARNVGFGLFAGVPLLRDAAVYGKRELQGEYATLSTPLTRVIDSAVKAGKTGWNFATEGETPERPIKQVGDLTAILGGVPTSQIGTTTQFLWDYSDGEVEPDTISDWYFGLSRGKAPDE